MLNLHRHFYLMETEVFLSKTNNGVDLISSAKIVLIKYARPVELCPPSLN